MDKKLITKSKKFFTDRVNSYGKDPWSLILHVSEAEKWAKKLFQEHPEINQAVIIITIWLHDSGHYPITKNDHAVVSEKIARDFLTQEKIDKKTMDEILHCIRSHRNRDVKPKTPEAKLFAALDSISHFTYAPYLDMMRDGRGKQGMEKLERDFRDIQSFPDLKKELTPLYKAWKKLLQEVDKINLYE
jgi:hypothetical protein